MMDMQDTAIGDVKVARLQGRFDAYEAPRVEAWLAKSAAQPPAELVVNLEGVNFLDSTALATLVRGMKNCRQRGGNLRLCCLQPPVRVIFELTRLDRAFDLYPSEEKALSAVSDNVA